MRKTFTTAMLLAAANAVKLIPVNDYDCFTYIASDVELDFAGPASVTITWTEPSTEMSTISAYTVYMLDHDFKCEKSPCTIDTSAMDIPTDALVTAYVVPIWDRYFALPLPVNPSDATEVCTPGASAQALADALKAQDEEAAKVAFDLCPMDMKVSPLYKGFDQGSSALSQAIKLGYLDVVVELINYGADVDEQNADDNDKTPLMLTCSAPVNQAEMADVLITEGADPQIRDRNGLSPLNYADTKGSLEVAYILEAQCVAGASAKALSDALKAKDEKAANISFDGCPMDPTLAPLHKGFDQGYSALSYAVKLGYLDVVDELISFGADVDEQNADDNDKTPLMLACKSQKNQVEVTKALLTADADPQIRDRNGLSPLNYANTEGSSEVADILEAECVAGASAKVLAEALQAQDEKAAKIAFDGCPMDMTVAPLHKGFEEGFSALSYAVRLGYLDVVLELISYGADVNEQNSDQNDVIPLMQTCEALNNQAEMTKALITAGADPQIRDINGLSALNLANSRGFTKVANILRAECVDGASAKALADALKAQDERAAIIAFDGCPMDPTVAPLHKGFVKGSSALSYAARQGYIDVVDELIFYGADVNEQNADENNRTPLMQACYAPKNQALMAKALLNVDADPQIRDSIGQTALEIAIEQGFNKAADILKAECVPGYSLHALEFALKEGDKKSAIAAFDGCPMDLTKSDALHDAVESKFIEVVKELIAYGADVNQYGNGKYNTLPLSTACEHGPELINILLAAGADPNKFGGEFLDYPTVYKCVEYNNADGLSALIEAGADVKTPYKGRSQLLWAIHHKKTKAQKVIQDEVCVPGASLKVLEKALKDKNENNAINAFDGCPMDLTKSKALGDAIKLGYLNVVEQLIEYGANVKVSTFTHNSYFHFACEATRNQASMVSALKNAGADVNYLGGNSYSAAHHCIMQKNDDALKALVSAGANLNQVYSGRTVKEAAVYYNYKKNIDIVCASSDSVRVLERALAAKSENNAINAFDGCPMVLTSTRALENAIKLGYLNVVKQLIAYGANVKVTTGSYETNFHYVCEATRNQASMVSALKNAGADVNYLGGQTWSAADHCIWLHNVEGFKALVNAGANLKQVWNGMTVIEYAAYTKNNNLINVVCTSGASLRELESALKYKDERRAERAFNGCPMSLSSSSALVDAVKLGYLDVVKQLIAYGANVKVTNAYYKTYFHYACEAKRNVASMISALKNAGADVNYYGGSSYHSAAHRCVALENVEGLQALVNAGADLKQVDNGRTVIEYAAYTKKQNIINVVCKKNGVEIELYYGLKDKDEGRAQRAFNGCPIDQYSGLLHKAFTGRQPEQSALYTATQLGYYEVVDELINLGVDIEERNQHRTGQTPLMQACYAPHHRGDMVRLYAKAGANLNAQEWWHSKFTAAHICANENETDGLGALMDNHCNTRIRNAYGWTVYDTASERSKMNSRSYLRRRGVTW